MAQIQNLEQLSETTLLFTKLWACVSYASRLMFDKMSDRKIVFFFPTKHRQCVCSADRREES